MPKNTINTIVLVQIPKPGQPPRHTDQGWYWVTGSPPFTPATDLSTNVAEATKQTPKNAQSTAKTIAAAQPGIRASTWRVWGKGTLREVTALYEKR